MFTQKQVERIIDKGKFVFIGTVEKRNASNLDGLTADRNTFLVKIEKVLHAPPALKHYDNQLVTVKVPQGATLKEGARRVFYTKGLMYGEKLAVQAVSVDTASGAENDIIKTIRGAVSNLEVKKIKDKIDSAELIIEGKIVKMEDAEINKHYPISHKHPSWVVLTILIGKVEKGRYNQKKILVHFESGGEGKTNYEPKIGQRGVWMVKKIKPLKYKKINTEIYSLGDSENFLNSYEYHQVKK